MHHRTGPEGGNMTFRNPQWLIGTDALQEQLDDPALRVLDCTVHLRPAPGGGVQAASGHEDWARAHIPGSGHADLPGDLSDRDSPLPLMMPRAEQFAAAMSRYGVGEGTRVVLYDTGGSIWAARVWWMLRAFGFDAAAVLDGGFAKWMAEGRPVSREPPHHPPGNFIARQRPGFIASKQDVLDALAHGGTCLVNALSADEHAGRVTRVARPGHIPGSANVPAQSLLDPRTNAFRPAGELRAAFGQAGVLARARVITYCGGGIAAAGDAFALALLGVDNVALYDGSLVEWTQDASLPMATG
jgi:thiosulfate/3-mercaptopyruvate sulfurtransferase